MNRKLAIAGRLRAIREELFGINGADIVAQTLHLPVATWQNYEKGVTIPGEHLVAFLVVFSVDPGWLLTGDGERHTTQDSVYGVES
jgi:hypothetical protein